MKASDPIIARSLGMPAVVGLGDIMSRLEDGTHVIVDGIRGQVIVDPDPAQVRRFERIQPVFIRAGESYELDESARLVRAPLEGTPLEGASHVNFTINHNVAPTRRLVPLRRHQPRRSIVSSKPPGDSAPTASHSAGMRVSSTLPRKARVRCRLSDRTRREPGAACSRRAP